MKLHHFKKHLHLVATLLVGFVGTDAASFDNPAVRVRCFEGTPAFSIPDNESAILGRISDRIPFFEKEFEIGESVWVSMAPAKGQHVLLCITVLSRPAEMLNPSSNDEEAKVLDLTENQERQYKNKTGFFLSLYDGYLCRVAWISENSDKSYVRFISADSASTASSAAPSDYDCHLEML